MDDDDTMPCGCASGSCYCDGETAPVSDPGPDDFLVRDPESWKAVADAGRRAR